MSVTGVSEIAACSGVSVVHGRGAAAVHALDGVDFTVQAGERVALFGPSGCGKTTLLHVLGGLVEPADGEVRWHGESLATLDRSARSRRRGREIALVFQGANLLPTFTAFENVAFAARASRGSAAPEEVIEMLSLVGLERKLDALASELSGGEAQRVAIARALAQGPALLLCDEPTGHLDSDTGARVLDLISALQTEFGFAQVTATHDAEVAARSDRTVSLADSRVTAEERFA